MMGDVKKAARGTWHAISDLYLAVQAPRTVERYYRLCWNNFRPDYAIRCRPKDRLIYIEIPKAASRTLHALLGSTYSIRQLGLPRFFELADDPETTIFTFTRNPFDRLASCYRNKFQGRPIRCLAGYRKDVRRHFGFALRGLNRDKPLPFAQFVEMACATCRTGTDGHWLQMDRLIPSKDLAPHFIGRVESFEHDLDRLADRLRFSGRVPRLNATPKHELWTPALRRQVEDAYQPDFERFGY